LITITIKDILNTPLPLFLAPYLVFFPSLSAVKWAHFVFSSNPHPKLKRQLPSEIFLSFHPKKISEVSVVGISDSIRSDMIKLQVGLPRARAEIPCSRPPEGSSLSTTCRHECDGGRLGITEGVISFVG
jgi:hypothetical protein